jgi:anti-sigma regulatory factor (Ser/Thr protein kinase)
MGIARRTDRNGRKAARVTASFGAVTSERRRLLGEFSSPSRVGNERLIMDKVAEAISPLNLSQSVVERLKTAVSEAAMNAIEHGNEGRPDVPVFVEVSALSDEVVVAITDQGGAEPGVRTEEPDIHAKLAGRQKPRGWGLYLIESMVDDMRVTRDGPRHTVELVVHTGDRNDS